MNENDGVTGETPQPDNAPATPAPPALPQPSPGYALVGTYPPEPPAATPTIVRSRVGLGAWIGIVLGLLVAAAWVTTLVLLSANQQRIIDQFTVWNFEPSAGIESHIERTGMTEEARFLYLASKPAVVADEEFNPICSDTHSGDGVLGCYLTGYQQIFLFEVTDERLDGAEEVTAAHEMLHAAWDRMTEEERESLNGLLEAEVTARADDEELADTLDWYAEAEPGERTNELHSIVGTQFADISAELEEHYTRYFVDRTLVSDLHEASQAVVRAQIAEGEALVTQLEELEAKIESDYEYYNAGYDQLSADIDSFNARADSGDFSSQAQFDAERAALVARQADLDALYLSIDARATEYENLRLKIEQLSYVIEELGEGLNIEAPRTV